MSEKRGTFENFDELTAHLLDGMPHWQGVATIEMGKLASKGDERALKALIQALKHGKHGYIRANAASVLGKLSNERIDEVLREAKTKDEDLEVRMAAAKALNEEGEASGVTGAVHRVQEAEKGEFKRSIVVEADSVEEARNRARSQVPEGAKIISEQILSRGRKGIVKGIADTIESAFEKAERKIKSNLTSSERSVQTKPGWHVVRVEALDENDAKSKVQEDSHGTIKIHSVALKDVGKKGLLGLGEKPNSFEIKLFQQAVVSIAYKAKVQFRINIKEQRLKCYGCGRPAKSTSLLGPVRPLCGKCESIINRLLHMTITHMADATSHSSMSTESCILEVLLLRGREGWKLKEQDREKLVFGKTTYFTDEGTTIVRTGPSEYVARSWLEYLD